MEQTLGNILGKTNDYKLCSKCKKINWYENKACLSCSGKRFKKTGQGIARKVNADLKYYESIGDKYADEILEDI